MCVSIGATDQEAWVKTSLIEYYNYDFFFLSAGGLKLTERVLMAHFTLSAS